MDLSAAPALGPDFAIRVMDEIIEFCRDLKSKAAKAIVQATQRFQFPVTEDGHQVWQESFKAVPLWSGWMIDQKINYIHANPVKANLVNERLLLVQFSILILSGR